MMDTWTRKSGYDTCLQAASDELNTSGTEVHLIRFRDGKFCHFHKATTEFFHFTKGIGRVLLNGKEQPLYPGTSLVIKPFDVHTFMNDSDEELLEAVMVKVNTHPEDTFVCDPAKS